ncbi:MAG: hypothetical protein PHX78_06465 [bacterium]|nr:hypothetical protein [bacterium]
MKNGGAKVTKKLFLTVIAVLIVSHTVIINAAQYLPKSLETPGNLVVVGGSETFHNLYVAGASVAVNKDVSGDLFVAGGSVNMAGQIEKDLFAAGGNVNVSNRVGDDARLAGGNVSITAPVAGDLLVAGGTVSISKNATVGGDLWAAGGVINLNGSVAKSAMIAGGEIFINGAIEGPLEVRAGKKLVFGPEARVAGPIKYYGRQEAQVQEGAKIGAIEFIKWKGKKHMPYAGRAVAIVLKMLALFLAGIIFIKLFRAKLSEVVTSAYKNFWSDLGVGVAGLLVVPIAVVLLIITLIGAYAGIILGVLFLLLTLISCLIMVFFLGAIIEKLLKKNGEIRVTWLNAVWGTLAFTIISLIPFIGWVAVFILFTASFGALLKAMRRLLEI